MAQDIVDQFSRKFGFPIETDRQVDTITLRNSIPSGIRWEGMLVYVVQDAITYQLKGGILDSNWEAIDIPQGALIDRGNFNAGANLPNLQNVTSTIGQTYKVTNAGASGVDKDFGSGVINVKDGDIISHNGTEFYKLADNNQAGSGSITIEPTIIDGSTNAVENNAVFDTFRQTNLSGIQSSLVFFSSLKFVSTFNPDLTTLTYDRNVIFIRQTPNNPFILVNESAIPSIEDVLSNTGYVWQASAYLRSNTNSGMPILQRDFTGNLTSTPIPLTGLNASYTAYAFEIGNSSAGDSDFPNSQDAAIVFSLISVPTSGTPITVDSALTDGSTNPVENNAIFDETQILRTTIDRSNLVDKLNNFYSFATFKGLGTVVTDFSTITYDRGVIFCRDALNSYMLIRNPAAVTGTIVTAFQSEVFNNDGRKFWWALLSDVNTFNGLPLIQNRVYGFLTNNPVTLTGVPATYTAYVFESSNLPFDFDANNSGRSFVNASLVRPAPPSVTSSFTPVVTNPATQYVSISGLTGIKQVVGDWVKLVVNMSIKTDAVSTAPNINIQVPDPSNHISAASVYCDGVNSLSSNYIGRIDPASDIISVQINNAVIENNIGNEANLSINLFYQIGALGGD